MTPELGFTQYLLGAVVLILKHTLLSEGLISLIVDETAEVKGPRRKGKVTMTLRSFRSGGEALTVKGQFGGRVDGQDLLGLGHGDREVRHSVVKMDKNRSRFKVNFPGSRSTRGPRGQGRGRREDRDRVTEVSRPRGLDFTGRGANVSSKRPFLNFFVSFLLLSSFSFLSFFLAHSNLSSFLPLSLVISLLSWKSQINSSKNTQNGENDKCI